MVIDIPVIRDLALTASIGVAVLIFTNLLLLPVLLSYTGVSASAAERSLRAEKEEHRGKGLGAAWTFLDRFTTSNWAIGAIAVSLLLAIGGFAVSQRSRSATSIRARRSCGRIRATTRDNAYITRALRAVLRPVRAHRQDGQGRLPQVRGRSSTPTGWPVRCARSPACRRRFRWRMPRARSLPARSRAIRSG